ncbi:MAG: hypothetical protein ACI8R4_002460, partial [Paracoccaceae bacterium]
GTAQIADLRPAQQEETRSVDDWREPRVIRASRRQSAKDLNAQSKRPVKRQFAHPLASQVKQRVAQGGH